MRIYSQETGTSFWRCGCAAPCGTGWGSLFGYGRVMWGWGRRRFSLAGSIGTTSDATLFRGWWEYLRSSSYILYNWIEAVVKRRWTLTYTSDPAGWEWLKCVAIIVEFQETEEDSFLQMSTHRGKDVGQADGCRVNILAIAFNVASEIGMIAFDRKLVRKQKRS